MLQLKNVCALCQNSDACFGFVRRSDTTHIVNGDNAIRIPEDKEVHVPQEEVVSRRAAAAGSDPGCRSGEIRTT